MTADTNQALLIITGSYDATTDFLLPLLPAGRVFRFNTDLFLEYKLCFNAEGFMLTDPVGRSIGSAEIYKAYWRWPEWPAAKTAEERYVRSEVRYIVREMANLLWQEGKFVLVEPEAVQRTGKLLQLTRAKEFFCVPDFHLGIHLDYAPESGRKVVKSLSKSLVDGRFIFSTVVDPSELAPGMPWYMQEYVQADYDVTVVVVRDRLFAFRLKRDFLETSVDWREIPDRETSWEPIELPSTTSAAIFQYMRDLRLDFGRIDFLMDEKGDLHFCEVNPNPQYAWLDYEGKYGLLSAVVNELSPATERHSIPNAHPLAGR